MLDFLRQNASSWITKAILGVIALIFALYFGFGGGGRPQGPSAPVAKVNGENIPFGLYQQNLKSQVERINKSQPGQSLSDELRKTVELQTLQALIEQKLLSQAARDLGLRVSQEKLAQEIRDNPGFAKDGFFDEDYYLKTWLPFYQRAYGLPFEQALREGLLAQELQEWLTDAPLVSQARLDNFLNLEKTQLKLKALAVNYGEKSRNLEEAKALAQKWIKAGGDDEVLKTAAETPTPSENEKETTPPPLKSQELGPLSLYQLNLILGPQQSLEKIKCLNQLKPGEFCQEVWVGPQSVQVYQLVEKSQNIDETQAIRLKLQVERGAQAQALSKIEKALLRQAKIEQFL